MEIYNTIIVALGEKSTYLVDTNIIGTLRELKKKSPVRSVFRLRGLVTSMLLLGVRVMTGHPWQFPCPSELQVGTLYEQSTHRFWDLYVKRFALKRQRPD